MKLSFSIPAHNEEDRMAICLKSILREMKGKKHDIEIVVINNCSTDKTGEIARAFLGVKVVSEPRKGLLFARERGRLETTGEIIANIDADTELTPGWIERVFSEFERNPKLVALSGPYVYNDLSLYARTITKLFYLAGFLSHLIFQFILHKGAMLQGGNFIVRRSALEKIGGFNTSIDFYGEDTDLAKRISKVGYVKFSFRLPIRTSGRRLAAEGVFYTGARYAINYFWVLLFNKPFTKTSTDIRHEN